MSIPPIQPVIITHRREKADRLAQLICQSETLDQKLKALSHSLNRLTGLESPALASGLKELGHLREKLASFSERAGLRHERFQSGLITVSMAGLEKAGKTTFLRSLTGIDDLPTFDERCTAVCCEIHYANDRSDFDIEFYTETEFIEQVVRPMAETILNGLPDALKTDFIPPATADALMTLSLPPDDAVPGGTTAFKLLNDLRLLQTHFPACRENLGRPPLARRPLSELQEWVSHRQAASDSHETGDSHQRGRHLARVSAAKVCRIFTAFEGGSPHLRWIDTPGVDDPNRRARDLTLAAIAAETDLLIVASRPGAAPSPNENFHRFWDSITRQTDEINLMNRMLFILNCDRRVDPDAVNIGIHRKYLTDAGVPGHLFAGPLEAVKKEDAAALMVRVNEHLSAHLAEQDNLAIRTLESQFKGIQARGRLLHDELSKSHPSDAGQQEMENDAFHRWFHWYEDGKDSGFWTSLVAALDRATRTILEDQRILESEKTLNTIFAEEAKAIHDQIPSPETLEDYVIKNRGENCIPQAMRAVSIQFSKLVNRLASEVQEFGPLMQERLVKVLEEAGLGPLLEEESAHDQLQNLLTCLEPTAALGNSVVEVLHETLELPRNLKYVIRYELRPAVDFCDPTLWNSEEDAWNRLVEMIRTNGGDAERLAAFQTLKHPPVTDTREKDHEILKKIVANALLAVHAALGNERYLPRRIADDFMRDCRVRLCFGPESEQEWRTLLYRNRGALLAGVIGKIRAHSERIQLFQTALNELEMCLP
jgi:hypothetical protein